MRHPSRMALVAIVLLAGPPVARSEVGVPDPSRRVDALFSRWSADTPGCAVGVSRDGGEVVRRAYGSADLEHGVANTPDTVFEAGSVSKQFTAAAVILLAQAGKLSLEDPVRQTSRSCPTTASRSPSTT